MQNMHQREMSYQWTKKGGQIIMPRVHFVKNARKDYPEVGIQRGDSYYWWKFRFGGKHKSKIRPKPSQLTQSDFLSRIYELQERFEGLSPTMSIEDIESEVDTIIDELRELADEQSDKQSNMPDSLQYSTVGELLENRADSCNEMADELEAIDLSVDSIDDMYNETKEDLDCDDCEEKAKYKTDDGNYCEEHFEEWKNSKEDDIKSEIEEKISELQEISYNGE